jgi:hypothetical protein
MLVKGPQCIPSNSHLTQACRLFKMEELSKEKSRKAHFTINVFWLMLGDEEKGRLSRDVSPKVSTRIEP